MLPVVLVVLRCVTGAACVSAVQHNAKLPTEMLDEALRRIEEELRAIGRVRRGYEAGQKSVQPDIQLLKYGTPSHAVDGSPAQPAVDVDQETPPGAMFQIARARPSQHHASAAHTSLQCVFKSSTKF